MYIFHCILDFNIAPVPTCSTASRSSSWWAASAGICAHMTGAMGTGGHTVGMLGEWRLLREWAACGWLRRGQLDVEPQGGAAGSGWARV